MLAPGEVVIDEGSQVGRLFVVVDGSLAVTRGGVTIATVDEPGAVIGEVSHLLDTVAGATVTAATAATVHVIDDPAAFLAEHPAALREIARLMAHRLNRLVAVLADVTAQYGDQDGTLGLLGDVLGTLTFSSGPEVEPGSDRDPDPIY